MKKLLVLFAALCALMLWEKPAFATEVQISVQTLSQLSFNPTTIGSDRTITVSATNLSFTITSAGMFPPQAVGLGGFQILIDGDQYQVESVASTSSANLTTQFAGSTGSYSVTWYKWVELRTYNVSSFSWQPLNSSEIIQPGTVGSGAWYKRVACSITNPGGGNILWIPAFTISATTDSPSNNSAKYSFVFFRTDGSLLQYFTCGATNQLAVPPTTPTTLAAICAWNAAPAIIPPNSDAYSKAQIDQRFPSCFANALPYYQATGNVMSCLTLGSGLSITNGIIDSSGGSGGLADPGSNGVVVRTALNTTVARAVTGTANEITATNGNGVSGSPTLSIADAFDISGKTSTAPIKKGTALPGTCSIGQFFFDTDATAGSNLFACTASNTWTLQGGGGGSIGPGTTGQGAYYASNGSALTAFTYSTSYFTPGATLFPKGIREAINVKLDFGCVGDGVANDQTCMANAITSGLSTGKPIYVPAGTYLVTGLTLAGRTRMFGDYDQRPIIKSTSNAPIINMIGDGGIEFRGPTLEDVQIQGAVGAGSNQIGLNVTDVTFVHSIRVNQVTIIDTGSYGLFVGNAYSSNFSNMFIENNANYPLLYDGANMPTNHFESIYVGNLRNTAPTGYRIKSGRFDCTGCNGVNNIPTGSSIMTLGRKSGVDGDVTNGPAFMSCHNCNFESYNVYGVRHYSDSASDITGYSTFAGDPANLGNLQPLAYEVIAGNFPDFTPRRGRISDTTVFGDGGYANYANSQPIHSTGGIPPVMTEGMGPGVASELATDPVATYYDHTLSSVQPLKRADGLHKRFTVTGTTAFTRSSVRYIETNCAAPCTITIPWPGWYRTGEEITIKDIAGNAATNNVTVVAASGGFVNGAGSFVINKNSGWIKVMPNDTSTDWRIVGVGTNAFPVYSVGSAGGFMTCWNSTGVSLTFCSGLFDLGAGTTVSTGNFIFNTDNANDIGASASNRPRTGYFATSISAPRVILPAIASGSIGTPANGQILYCSNCAVTGPGDNTCAGGGTGAIAFRLNGVWRCFDAQN